jgi:hypothetical protein
MILRTVRTDFPIVRMFHLRVQIDLPIVRTDRRTVLIEFPIIGMNSRIIYNNTYRPTGRTGLITI